MWLKVDIVRFYTCEFYTPQPRGENSTSGDYKRGERPAVVVVFSLLLILLLGDVGGAVLPTLIHRLLTVNQIKCLSEFMVTIVQHKCMQRFCHGSEDDNDVLMVTSSST